jgi:4-hydroxymandelate synthase
MGAQDTEYAELYVNDKTAVVNYFVHSMGFVQLAESSSGDRDSVLLRQGSAQLVVTAGPGVREFLDSHGDGVADIALTCDDIDATIASGVAAGIRPLEPTFGNPALPGFGEVRHTLLPLSPNGRRRLPPGRDWIPTPPALARPCEDGRIEDGRIEDGRIKVLDHVAVCLDGGTLDECATMYQEVFGLSRYSGEYTELGDQAMDSIVVRSPSYGVTFTLLAQDQARSPGQIDAFVNRNCGPGVQHLAFEVDDIIPTVWEFRELGVDFLSTPGTYYDMLLERIPEMRPDIMDLRSTYVLADRDEWGYLLQLFTRSPYERNTLFYELIQRRGARGFGGANIRALYEAVERDRLAAQ